MSSLNIRAFLSEDYFIDIGIPEDYEKAQFDFEKKKVHKVVVHNVVNFVKKASTC